MATYIGTDIIEIKRIQEALTKFGDKFKHRIFTKLEQSYSESRTHPEWHYAVRFAAKESVVKAFKTGFSQGIKWTDIEIRNEASGAPFVVLYNAAKEYFEKLNGQRIEITLSHTDNYAQAVALIETG